ncbi:MAG: NUDIX domain-containing protein [Bacteroidota bacterium]
MSKKLRSTQELFPAKLEQKIQFLRKEIREHGISKEDLIFLKETLGPYKELLFENPHEEILKLVDPVGEEEVFAPRWLCHFMGIAHSCVHILILWEKADKSKWVVLQMRDWDKEDMPGHLDLSAAGHIQAELSVSKAAEEELFEELGLRLSDLLGNQLHPLPAYDFYEEKPELNFYNAERRMCYLAKIDSQGLERIRFEDGELAGVYLCPLEGVNRLLEQSTVPMASGLTQFFKHQSLEV